MRLRRARLAAARGLSADAEREYKSYLAAAHPDIARDPGTGIAGLFGSGAPWVRLLIAAGADVNFTTPAGHGSELVAEFGDQRPHHLGIARKVG